MTASGGTGGATTGTGGDVLGTGGMEPVGGGSTGGMFAGGGTDAMGGTAPATGATGGDTGGTAPAGGGGMSPMASGGFGGAMPDCGDYPLPPQDEWIPSASSSSIDGGPGDPLYNPPTSALDENLSTRWSTGDLMTGNEWFQVDFSEPVRITRVVLQSLDGDHSRSLAVYVGDEPATTIKAPPVATAMGTSATTNVPISGGAIGRYLVLQNLEAATSWWSIQELQVTCSD